MPARREAPRESKSKKKRPGSFTEPCTQLFYPRFLENRLLEPGYLGPR